MNTTWALIGREIRDSRISLCAAPLVSAVVLIAVHSFFELPFAVSQAAAMAVLILIPVWTLYFGADLFATDCASGRMSTKALLPVSAYTLWSAKALFLALTIMGLTAGIVSLELLLHSFVGTPESLEHFAAQTFFSHSAGIPVYVSLILLLGATAVLSSLLVENALVAMLLSLMAAASLAGAGWALDQALVLAGIKLSGTQWLMMGVGTTVILLALSAKAFARGQRKLGLRLVRTRYVLATLSALVVVSGLSTAAIVYRGVMTGMEHPLARFRSATVSADERYLAIETETKLARDVEAARMVWMIDLDTGRRDLVTNSGSLIGDPFSCETMPWDSGRSLRVLGRLGLPWKGSYEIRRVEATDAGVEVSSIGGELQLDSRWVPAWAEVTRGELTAAKTRELRIRWKERAIERTFVGDPMSTAIGRGVYLSPTPGRLVVLRDGRVTLLDLDSDSERVLIEEAVGLMWPSPDGSALLCQTEEATHALSGLDGNPLHQPWPRATSYVQWVSGNGDARVVRIAPHGREQSERILDLRTQAEFEARYTPGQHFIYCLGERGFVSEVDNDLVWIDSKGAVLKVLVDR